MSFPDLEQLNKQAGLATVTINDDSYTVHLLPTTIGLAMSLEIGKLLMPSLGAGIDGFRHDEILHGAPTTFADLGKLLVLQMGEVKIVEMVKALLSKSEINGKQLDFEKHFSGNYGALIQLVEFALRENFESFFTESGLQTRFVQLMSNLSIQPAELEE